MMIPQVPGLPSIANTDILDLVALAAVLIPEPVTSAAGATALGVKGAATGAKLAASGGKVVAKTGAKAAAKGAVKKTTKEQARKMLVDKAKEKAKEKAKNIAKDKLLGKKGSKKRRIADAAMGEGGEGGEGEQFVDEGEKGGELAIRPTTSLVPEGPSALTKTSPSTGSKGGGDSVEQTVLHIKTTVIDVQNLLGESYAFKEKVREDERKRKEQAQLEGQEDALEEDAGTGKESKFKIPKPKVVMSFWDRIKKFFINTFLGFIAVRLLPVIPTLMQIVPPLVHVADALLSIVGWVMNGLITVIDWGYKLYDWARGVVTSAFGEGAGKIFDGLMGALNTLINAFLVWKIIGKKLFEALIQNIKNAWKIAAAIVKRAINFAKNAINFAKNLIKNVGKFLNKIPGVKNILKGASNLFRGAMKAGGNFIKGATKAGGKLLKVGAKAGKGALQAGKGLLSKGLQAGKGLAAKGAAKVGGIAGKIFGKAAKFIVPGLKAAKPIASKVLGKIPILGPIVVAVISILTGDPPGLTLFKTIGAVLGGILGMAIPIPILGPIIGETIGVFLGELLYGLITKGASALKDVAKKIASKLGEILSAGKVVLDWVGAGFKRFWSNFMEEHSFKLPWWVSGPINKLTGMDLEKIPNVLQLANPLVTFPLLVKSFFPPKEEKAPQIKQEKGKEPPKKEQEKEKGGSSSSSSGDSGDEPVTVSLTATDDPGKELILSMQQAQSYEDIVNVLRTLAPYEQTSTKVVPAIQQANAQGKSRASEVAMEVTSMYMMGAVAGGDDPYEKLYRGDS